MLYGADPGTVGLVAVLAVIGLAKAVRWWQDRQENSWRKASENEPADSR